VPGCPETLVADFAGCASIASENARNIKGFRE